MKQRIDPINSYHIVPVHGGGVLLSEPNTLFKRGVLAQRFVGTRSGVDLPDYRRRLASSQNATTPYSGTFYSLQQWDEQGGFTLTAHDCVVGGRYVKKWAYVPTCAVTSPSIAPTFTFLDATNAELARIQNVAAQALRGKAAQESMKADALVFMGELAETIALLKSPLREIPRLTRKLQRRLQKAARRAEKKGTVLSPEQLNNLYLGWCLGVAPILGETAGIAEAIASAVLKESHKVRRVTVHGEPRAVTTNSQSATSRVTKIDTVSCGVRALIGVRMSLDADDVSSRLLLALNLDGRSVLSNFVPSMWELIPFSFLLDYVGNFGAVIDSRYGSSAHVAWSSFTTREVAVSRRLLWKPAPPASKPAESVEEKSRIELPYLANLAWRRVKLTRSDSIPSVTFSFSMPNPRQLSIAASLTLALSGAMKGIDKILRRHYNVHRI